MTSMSGGVTPTCPGCGWHHSLCSCGGRGALVMAACQIYEQHKRGVVAASSWHHLGQALKDYEPMRSWTPCNHDSGHSAGGEPILCALRPGHVGVHRSDGIDWLGS